MGVGVGLVLVAAGAILVWGVTSEPEGLDLDAIGVVLMVVGIVGLLLSLLLWRTWWGPGYWGRSTYVEGGPERPWYYGGWSRRRTYVEDDQPPPPGPPPPPP